MNPQPTIIDVSEADFREAVLARSRDELILVDFWADWCRPCRQLAPILDKLVHSMPGKFVLARVNTDENTELAASLRIQSIPSVLFFRGGRIVDELVGVVPEDTIKTLIEKHAPSAVEPLLRQAEEADARGDLGESLRLLRQALAAEPDHPRANFLFGGVALRSGLIEPARSALQKVPAETPEGRGAERILSAFAFFALSAAGDPAPQTPAADLDQRLRRASRLATTNHLTAALDELLEIITIDKNFAEGLARQAVLGLFVLLGQNSDTTRSYQDRLARILY